MKLLSIVTVTYRDASGMAETLRSLDSLRGVPGWDHVVVDSSPSETSEALSDLSPDYPLAIFEMPPRGIYPAMNFGLERATGAWIWFLNSGDRAFEPREVLAAVEAAHAAGDVEGVLGGARYHRDHRYAYTRRPRAPWWRGLRGTAAFCQQAILFKREVYQRVGTFSEEYTLAGDYEFHLRCWIAGVRVETIPTIVCEHELGGRSDDYRRTLGEARRINRHHAPSFPRRVRVAATLNWCRSYLKAALAKSLAKRSWGDPLRALWWRLKRGFDHA